jgi:hypothetical protein
MGSVRGREFDAVIGIGGIGKEAQTQGVDGTLNWIGVGPRKTSTEGRGPLVTFDHFLHFFDEDAPALKAIAPNLARRFYGKNAPRHLIDDFTAAEQAEIDRIVEIARDAPPSMASSRARKQRGRRRRPRC